MSCPTLADFVDEELLRAPMMLDEVFDAVQQGWKASRGLPPPPEELVRGFARQRAELVRLAMRSLREQVAAEVAVGTAAGALVAAPAAELSLVEDDEVVADIELTRTVQRVKSTTEFELLELQAYTSALVGDLDVARDTNPVRPVTWVQALSSAAQGVGFSRGAQAALLRAAAEPLALVLRKAYAASCARLESQGVEPGAYRTIVLQARLVDLPPASLPAPAVEDLAELRDSMPMPLDEPRSRPAEFEAALRHLDHGLRALPAEGGAQAAAQALGAARSQLMGSASSKVDQQLIEMLTRLFDAMLADRHLPRGAFGLLSRLQPSLLRLALRDGRLLRDWDHPAWRFMDQLVFLLDRLGGSGAPRTLAHLQGLVDHLLGEPVQDAARFAWGLERLSAFERHRVEQARGQAAAQIAHLKSREARPAGDGSGFPPTETLDIGSMDTLPASLVEASGEGTATALDAAEPGTWLRLHLQGEWRTLVLLWRSDAMGSWLLLDPPTHRHWAVRRRAMDQMATAGVAWCEGARSLVKAAADRVMRQLEAEAGQR